MQASFDVDGKEFKVVFSFFGTEKFYYDGQLLLSRWSFKLNDRLSFDLGNSVVEINIMLSRKRWSTQAFVNNKLVVDELFPDVKSKLETPNNGMTSRSTLGNVVLWLVLAIGFMFLFQWLQSP